MKATGKRSDCPIGCSLDVWGDKWTLLIIRDLMDVNGRTYGDFLKSPEGIATNILASRLQALEENQLVVKLEHPDSKAKVLYKLTQKGIDLLPIMIEINLWAEKYFIIPEERKAMLEEVKKDKAGFIKKMTKDLIASNDDGSKLALFFPHYAFFRSCSYGYTPSKSLRVVENSSIFPPSYPRRTSLLIKLKILKGISKYISSRMYKKKSQNNALNANRRQTQPAKPTQGSTAPMLTCATNKK